MYLMTVKSDQSNQTQTHGDLSSSCCAILLYQWSTVSCAFCFVRSVAGSTATNSVSTLSMAGSSARHYLVPNVPNTINGMCSKEVWQKKNHAKLCQIKIINDSIQIQWSMPILEVTGNVSASKHLINLVITEGFTFQLCANLPWHVFGIRLWKAYHMHFMHFVLSITFTYIYYHPLVDSFLSSNVGHFRRSQNALFLLSLSKFAQ